MAELMGSGITLSNAHNQVETEKNQDRITRVMSELQNGTLKDPDDIEFFLKRVRKGEYPNFSLEDAQKTADLIARQSKDEAGNVVETEKVWTGTKVNSWVRAKKERLAKKLKNRLDDTKVLEIQKELELKAARLGVEGFTDYKNSDDYKKDMERVKEAASLIKNRQTKWWEPKRYLKKYYAKKFEQDMKEKLDPLATLDSEIARRKKISPIRAYQLLKRHNLPHKKIERLNERESKRQKKITKLETQIGRSSWYQDWGSKIELGFHRMRSESNREKLIAHLPLNDAAKYEQNLLAKKAELQAANGWDPATKRFDKTMSKLEFKRLGQQMEKIEREMAQIKARREVLKPLIAEKTQKVEDRLNPKIEKKKVRIEDLSEKIDVRNVLLTQRTEYRKAAEYLSGTHPELKSQLDAVLRENTERQITTDKDFINTLKEAGVNDEMMKDLARHLQENPNKAPASTNQAEKTPDAILETADPIEKYQKTIREVVKSSEEKTLSLALEGAENEFVAKAMIAAQREGLIVDNVDTTKYNSNMEGLSEETRVELKKIEAERSGEPPHAKVHDYTQELQGNHSAEMTEKRLDLAAQALNADDKTYEEMKKNSDFVRMTNSDKEIKDMDNLRTINEMNKLMKQAGISGQDLANPDKTEFNKKFESAMVGMDDKDKAKFNTTKDKYLGMNPEDKKRARQLGITVKQLSTMDPTKRRDVINKTKVNTQTMARGADNGR